MSRLEFLILGSGTSTGVPAIGCSCTVCQSDAPRNKRTRCSALIRYEGKTILLDTSTDLRWQALREGIDQIDAVLYTHSHADHVHGIDDLRSFNRRGEPAIPIYGDSRTIEGLTRTFRYIFQPRENSSWTPRLLPRSLEAPEEICGLPILPIPLEHGSGRSQGYRVGPMAYLTDCSGLPDGSAMQLQGLELLVIDGLRHRPHRSHLTIAQACELARELGAQRTVLTHLSHDVDYEVDSRNLPSGIELAWDGLRVELTMTERD